MAAEIIKLAFATLFSNFQSALKASFLPFGAVAVLFFVVAILLQRSGVGGATIFFVVILGLALFLFVFSWVAVTWHRFFLNGEEPTFIPQLQDRPIKAYMGKSVILFFAMLLALIPMLIVMFVLGSVFGISTFEANVASFSAAQTVLNLIFGTIFGYVWFRVALGLPAIAVGDNMKVSESWAASAKFSSTILGVAFGMALINTAASFLSIPIASLGRSQSTFFDILINWITIMVGVSVLSILYDKLHPSRSDEAIFS